jgi:hypothetical protein
MQSSLRKTLSGPASDLLGRLSERGWNSFVVTLDTNVDPMAQVQVDEASSSGSSFLRLRIQRHAENALIAWLAGA